MIAEAARRLDEEVDAVDERERLRVFREAQA